MAATLCVRRRRRTAWWQTVAVLTGGAAHVVLAPTIIHKLNAPLLHELVEGCLLLRRGAVRPPPLEEV